MANKVLEQAPKQMGKSSLMTRILVYSKNLGYQTVFVSLQLANDEILQNLERFLQSIFSRSPVANQQLGDTDEKLVFRRSQMIRTHVEQ
ncbi:MULTISPECIES: AAA-like domain-containing protein [Nostocales]|uniref:AAA-like domain-containing protein n=1 Tax=Nostocales TaxID=1161 RepID=UPI0028C47DA6|nr:MULTISPECIES: AAA-like domain-containing protein [Nostocales]